MTLENRKLNANLNTLRKNSIVPAIMYGKSLSNSVPVQLPVATLQSVLAKKSTTTLFTFNYNGEEVDCILRDYQIDALHTQVLHADFQLVKPDETILINLPVLCEGYEHLRPQKRVLQKNTPYIPMMCKASDLPRSITIDVGKMKKGDKVWLSDLELPSGSEVLLGQNTLIVSVH